MSLGRSRPHTGAVGRFAVLAAVASLASVSFQWPQSVFATQTVGRCDHVWTIKNFQKLRERLLGVKWSSLDVLRKQRLRIAHCLDDQLVISHADESGDVHGRFLRAGALGDGIALSVNCDEMDWFPRTNLKNGKSLWR
jgi:hypothetical protein